MDDDVSVLPENARSANEELEPGEELLSTELVLAFAPLHKLALGVGVGSAVGLAVFLITAFHVVAQPSPALQLELLAQFFYGFTVSWKGAFIGLFWGFVSGFVAGWFTAFSRNLVMATLVFLGQARAELRATKGFLDHI